MLNNGGDNLKIKDFRKKRNKTHTELAKDLGVSQQAIAMWETSTNKPRADKLIQLARILGCTIDELLKD